MLRYVTIQVGILIESDVSWDHELLGLWTFDVSSCFLCLFLWEFKAWNDKDEKLSPLKSFSHWSGSLVVKRHWLCLHSSYGIINLPSPRLSPNPHYSTDELLTISFKHGHNQQGGNFQGRATPAAQSFMAFSALFLEYLPHRWWQDTYWGSLLIYNQSTRQLWYLCTRCRREP